MTAHYVKGLVAAATIALTSTGAIAQQIPDVANLQAQCAANPSGCAALLSAALTSVQSLPATVSQAQINSIVGQISTIAVETANTSSSGAVDTALSQVLQTAATVTTDTEQSAALATASSNVSAGNEVDTTAIGGSPT